MAREVMRGLVEQLKSAGIVIMSFEERTALLARARNPLTWRQAARTIFKEGAAEQRLSPFDRGKALQKEKSADPAHLTDTTLIEKRCAKECRHRIGLVKRAWRQSGSLSQMEDNRLMLDVRANDSVNDLLQQTVRSIETSVNHDITTT